MPTVTEDQKVQIVITQANLLMDRIEKMFDASLKHQLTTLQMMPEAARAPYLENTCAIVCSTCIEVMGDLNETMRSILPTLGK